MSNKLQSVVNSAAKIDPDAGLMAATATKTYIVRSSFYSMQCLHDLRQVYNDKFTSASDLTHGEHDDHHMKEIDSTIFHAIQHECSGLPLEKDFYNNNPGIVFKNVGHDTKKDEVLLNSILDSQQKKALIRANPPNWGREGSQYFCNMNGIVTTRCISGIGHENPSVLGSLIINPETPPFVDNKSYILADSGATVSVLGSGLIDVSMYYIKNDNRPIIVDSKRCVQDLARNMTHVVLQCKQFINQHELYKTCFGKEYSLTNSDLEKMDPVGFALLICEAAPLLFEPFPKQAKSFDVAAQAFKKDVTTLMMAMSHAESFPELKNEPNFSQLAVTFDLLIAPSTQVDFKNELALRTENSPSNQMNQNM
ncbi:MAG: hypothetical protein WC627_01255 [Legionella sp.]